MSDSSPSRSTQFSLFIRSNQPRLGQLLPLIGDQDSVQKVSESKPLCKQKLVLRHLES